MKTIVTILFTCFVSNSISQENYAVNTIPESLLENANSVVRNELVTIDISGPKFYSLTSLTAITVLNKNGNEHISPYVYFDDNISVKRVEAIVYDKYGEEIKKYRKKDFIDISAVDGGTLYSDTRVLLLDYSPTEYPYTMVFEYIVETENTANIRPFFPLKGYNSSIEKSTYQVRKSPDVTLRYKKIDQSNSILLKEQPGVILAEVKNFKALEHEHYSPRLDTKAPHLLFALDQFNYQGVPGTGRNWNEFGKWMNSRLLHDVGSISESTRTMIRSLVANEESQEAKARKIYEYVQEKTRYISVQIGIGGWKPMPAEDVDELGYGDCKALTNYTKTLLDIAGIPSYYTVVYAGDSKRDIQSDFASHQGNHVILAIPDEEDYIWLECTNQNIPFGFLGDFTDDRDVLVVTPEGGQIAHTVNYEYAENKLLTSGVCKLNADGSISVDVVMESFGIQYGDRYAIENQNEDDKATFYKNYWDYIHNISINSINLENNKRDVKLAEHITFDAGSYTSFAGDDMIFIMNVLNRSNNIPKRYRNRTQPLKIDRGFLDKDEVIVEIPSGFRLNKLPEPIIVETKFGKYTATISHMENGNLKFERSFALFSGEYPKEEYEAYRAFRKKVSKSDNQKLILTKI